MTSRDRASLLAALISLLLAACTGFPEPCSEAAAAAHEAISHYGDGDLTPETHLAGGCTASFVTSDDADAVIEHYRSELLESGYTIQLVDSVPIEGEAGAIIGQAVGLEATNGPMFVSVSAEAYDGRENTYQVFTEEVEPSE